MTSPAAAATATRPLVSVIMPTYNRGALIGKSIESVLSQTYRELELIVIDNFSADDTEHVVQAYAGRDARVRYIKCANHGLVAASRNAGMRAATGTYLAFLDSDDLWLPEKLQKQVEFLERRTDVFLVYSKFFVSRNGKMAGVGPRTRRMARGRVFEQLFVSDNMIGSLTVMMRRADDASAYYFRTDRELYAVEDYDLWLRIARRETLDFIDEPLAIYTIHDTNMTASLRLFFDKNLKLMKLYRRDVPTVLLLRRYLVCFVPAIGSALYRKAGALWSDARRSQALP
jgi:glycosyltransferase involved in cell wall biosynthesis